MQQSGGLLLATAGRSETFICYSQMQTSLAGGARLSTVIVCELVSVGCKDGVTYIHTWAIVKWGSLPTAIPKVNTTYWC